MKDSVKWDLRERVTQAVQPVLWNSSNHPVPESVLGRDITFLTRKTVDAVLEVVPELVSILRREEGETYLCCDYSQRLERVRELHPTVKVYGECTDEGCTLEEVEVSDYYGCENTFEGYACRSCCFGNTEYMQEWCPHDLVHEGVQVEDACPTRAVTYNMGG